MRERAETSRTRYEEAREHYHDVHRVWPQDGVAGLFRSYLYLLALLFVGEFPMNMFVFRLFGENELLTALVTVGLAVPLLYCAHVLGDQLRQGALRSRKNVAITLAAVLIPALVLVAVSWVREDYLDRMRSIASEMNPTLLLLLFLSLNALIYLVATLMSHYVHDEPTRTLYLAGRERERSEVALAVAEQAVARAKAAHRETWQRHHNRAEEIQDTVKRCADTYWRENLYARADRGEHDSDYPAAYGEVPQVDIAPNLAEFREVAISEAQIAADEEQERATQEEGTASGEG